MSSNSSRFQNAIGYLDELTMEVNQQWFRYLRDIAVVRNSSIFEPEELDTIYRVLLGEIDQIPSVSPVPVVMSTCPTLVTDRLEQLSSFSNFKLLSDTLSICFKKRITLVFGTNGSGKSSLCEAFRLLSSPNSPKQPLENVRILSSRVSSFYYKFKNDITAVQWTNSCGYGTHSDKIKFFDSTTALHNVSVAVEPGRIISLVPFKLGIFEVIRELVTQVREALFMHQSDISNQLSQLLLDLNVSFQTFNNSPLKTINTSNCDVLAIEITKAESYCQQSELADLIRIERDYINATSDEGLQTLVREFHDLDSILLELREIFNKVTKIWVINLNNKIRIRDEKRAKQQLLVDELFPSNTSMEKLKLLIKAASETCDLKRADGDVCPLCKRRLEDQQLKLFHQYHDFITSRIENDIEELDAEIISAKELIKEIQNIQTTSWFKLTTLDQNMLEKVIETVKKAVDSCKVECEPTSQDREALIAINGFIDQYSKLVAIKEQVIESSKKGRAELKTRLEEIEKQIRPLAYHNLLFEKINNLQEANRLSKKADAISNILSGFTALLTKITKTAKTAYEDLVVFDFESRLNKEYINLTEKDMGAFGVVLKRQGLDATVTVRPQVGGRDIIDVLSEGELRIHSLALFFAELESVCCPVLVFDDPISSFDYNNIENFCIRLRNLAISHQDCQIIILTHNWEFFVQLQKKLNSSGLNNDLSIQVLENCCMVEEYSENIDELERDIKIILSLPNEPSRDQKEEMAGKMRRLIESIVNKYVFNDQRHQFKQKAQSVSVFQDYIKVIPLTQNEAIELTDLYSKLSIPEHDDPRNAYINTDKATFQSRYAKIEAIKNGIKSRR